MKIAVLGGSFNPIHIGHLALADEVCTSLGYDKILFIPTYNPPHKELNEMTAPSVRVEMVKLACCDDERFESEECEILRGGVSYTYDTLTYLYDKYSGVLDDKIGLIMGEDLLSHFNLWYKAEEIASMSQLILAVRPETASEYEYKNKPKGKYADMAEGFDIAEDKLFKNALFVNNPSLSVSSTDIRSRAACGRSFRYLVPSKVFKYIKDKGLYGCN